MTTNKIMNICFGAVNANSDKKFYTQHGIVVFGTNDQGEERISIKLSSLPIDADFTGWFSVFPKDDTKPVPAAKAAHTDIDVEF